MHVTATFCGALCRYHGEAAEARGVRVQSNPSDTALDPQGGVPENRHRSKSGVCASISPSQNSNTALIISRAVSVVLPFVGVPELELVRKWPARGGDYVM